MKFPNLRGFAAAVYSRLYSRRSIRSNRTAAILWILALALAGCASVPPRSSPGGPVMSLSATSFNFNTVVIGQSSTQTLHITNTGTAPLTLDSVTLKSSQFALSGPSLPRTILPGQNANYSLVFEPSVAGNASASIQIVSNASSAPASVSLAGVAEKAFASVQVTPSSISFGNLKLQSTATQNVTVKNTGDISITISGITVAGAGFGYSSLTPGSSLAPNQSLTFQIWFRPQAGGSASGSISILSANLPSPASISVSGAGVAEKVFASVQVTPSSISFGNLKLQSTATQNVTVKNTGDISITISGITVAGAGFGYSSLPPGSSLAPNQSLTFEIWFRPQAGGSASGSISILSADLSSPASISVSGAGVTSTPTSPTPLPHSVALTWGPSASSVVGYRVYRDDGSGYSPLSAIIPDLAYTDASVISGSTYNYVVTAVDSAGQESAHSNKATAVIPTP